MNIPATFQDLYDYDNGPRCSPLIDDERVYLFGAEGMLHCLDVEHGKLIWKLDTAAEFGVIQNFFGVGSTPVVEGDLLIVQVGGSPAESKQAPPGRLDLVVGNGSGIVAFDKKTGAVRYKITDELASYSSPKLATINGRRWCFVFARGGLVGFEPASGKVDFQFPWRASILESVNASNPVVVGDLVFISETYGPGSALAAREAGQGRRRLVRRRPAPRQGDANALEHAHPSRRLPLCFERSPYRKRRAALHRIRHGQSHVEPARPDARVAAVCRRSFRLPERRRHTAACCASTREKYDPVAEVVLAGQRVGAQRLWFRAAATDQVSGLGGADPVARPAVCARGRSAGLPGVDPRQQAGRVGKVKLNAPSLDGTDRVALGDACHFD